MGIATWRYSNGGWENLSPSCIVYTDQHLPRSICLPHKWNFRVSLSIGQTEQQNSLSVPISHVVAPALAQWQPDPCLKCPPPQCYRCFRTFSHPLKYPDRSAALLLFFLQFLIFVIPKIYKNSRKNIYWISTMIWNFDCTMEFVMLLMH